MIHRQLVFPHEVWERCRRSLFNPDQQENFLFGLARPCRRMNGIAYLVEQLLDPGQNGYCHRSVGGLTLTEAMSNRLNIVSQRAAAVGLVPVHLHSHPSGLSCFSHYDDRKEQDLHQWLVAQDQPLLWSLVWAYGGEPEARLWIGGKTEAGTVRAGLRVFGNSTASTAPALERQRAFGEGLRQATAVLAVGIVGLGGIGLLVAEQLARCGFHRFVLVDPDRLDVTNLNRMSGTTPGDIGRRKVHVARRHIRSASRCFNLQPNVRAFAQDIYVAPEQLRSLMRQCDIILALTDDELSRITCLQIALEGGAEYLQAGVDIRLDGQGAVIGLFAEVTGAEVNRYCPLCTGRLDPGQASVDARRYVGGDVWEHAQKRGYIPEVAAPSVMSLNAMAAGMLVLEIQRRVSGLGVRDLLQTDIQSGTMTTFEHIESQLTGECAVCGRGEHLVAG